MRYDLDEAILDLPGDLPCVDRSVHRLDVGGGDLPALSLVIERSELAPGQTLAGRVHARTQDLAAERRGFAVLAEQARSVGQLPGLVVASRWIRGGEAYFAIEAHVVVGTRHLTFIVTSSVHAREACEAWTDAMLAALRFRGDEP